MGAGRHIGLELDDLLRLHLEGRQVDWQISLCYIYIPPHHAACLACPRSHFTRRKEGHRVLHQARLDASC